MDGQADWQADWQADLTADLTTDGVWDEAWDYQPGFTVELKSAPGSLHIVESYDPMMVPPVWLADDPMPRYPHELKVISQATQYACPVVFISTQPRSAQQVA